MDHKYEEAVKILLKEAGYYWCEECRMWEKEEDKSWHIEKYHNK